MRLNKYIKVTLAVPIIILALGTTYHFGHKAFILHAINKHMSRDKMPNAYIIPVSRDIHPAVFNNSKTVETLTDHLKLKAPWKIKQQLDNELFSLVLFYDKRLITIHNRLKEEQIIDAFLKGTPEEVEDLKDLIGKEHLNSDFDFIRMCLNTTPDQATLYTPTRLLGKISTVLIMRVIYEPLGRNIFEFQLSNGLRGFQFRKDSEHELVRIFLFDEERLLFEIDFMLATQSEIDFVLSSIQVL